MKLDITSLYFNGNTISVGNTASWGTALGQQSPNYPVSVEGGQDLVNLIRENHVEFNPNENPNHKANIKSLADKIVLDSGKFEKVYVNNILIEGPFFLLIIEETSGSHIGRKSLKYNNKIEIDGASNEQFYQKIKNHFGENSCWFAYDISAINNQLHISIIKVDNNPMEYEDAKERKDHWESLINDFSDIKIIFKNYLMEVQKLEHQTTANKYLNALPKIQKWFSDNNLIDNEYQIWNIRNDNSEISSKLKNELKDEWIKLNQDEGRWYSTPWNSWLKFIEWYNGNLNEEIMTEVIEIKKIPFPYKSFHKKTDKAGLIFSEKMVARFVASLCTKPFVICSGLSGSGKTKLAQAFVQWICESDEQYKIIPVGADWTNREPLLGFPNGLEKEKYVKPDSGALDIIIKALEPENENKPFFLILDEMNLSHVERYFADFLSIMESKDKIKLYSGDKRDDIEEEIKWPKNLFIIGTVNIDETTYMFSPKVLDRANVIEFRISEEDLKKYLDSDKVLDMDQFLDETKTIGLGAKMGESFLSIASGDLKHGINNKAILINFFKELQKSGAEFGYRSASEINRLIAILDELSKDDNSWDGEIIATDEFIDIAIMQKLLPKLHGSRNKLTKVLPVLGGFCIAESKKEKIKEIYFDKVDDIDFKGDKDIIYKLSFEKICRMYKNAVENGYASYAEA